MKTKTWTPRRVALNMLLVVGAVVALVGFIQLGNVLLDGWLGVETCYWTGGRDGEVCGVWNKREMVDGIMLLVAGKLVTAGAWFLPKFFPKISE